MKNSIEALLFIGLATAIISIAINQLPKAQAAPTKGKVLSEYKVGRTTIYEWRTNHNRLCTMVVDRYASNAPFISCS